MRKTKRIIPVTSNKEEVEYAGKRVKAILMSGSADGLLQALQEQDNATRRYNQFKRQNKKIKTNLYASKSKR